MIDEQFRTACPDLVMEMLARKHRSVRTLRSLRFLVWEMAYPFLVLSPPCRSRSTPTAIIMTTPMMISCM